MPYHECLSCLRVRFIELIKSICNCSGVSGFGFPWDVKYVWVRNVTQEGPAAIACRNGRAQRRTCSVSSGTSIYAHCNKIIYRVFLVGPITHTAIREVLVRAISCQRLRSSTRVPVTWSVANPSTINNGWFHAGHWS